MKLSIDTITIFLVNYFYNVQIQRRVRQVSIADGNRTAGGNVPTAICTFTNDRKLYFFPGCTSKNSSD